MRRTEQLQGLRLMKFEEVYGRTLAVFHGPRCLARYQADGSPINTSHRQAA